MPDAADRELAAAGITGTQLRAAYRRSRAVHAAHGRSYFLATRMLAPARRPSVYALYGFARYADEIVDALPGRRGVAVLPNGPDRRAALDRLDAALGLALDSVAAPTPDQQPLLTSVAHTIHRHELDRALFAAFLTSMRMDTEITEYPDRAALDRYMYGSAGVIGLQLLPVLGTVCPPADAAPSAEALGVAFQLTNFLRDVGEDLDRGRVYLPADELGGFGVDRELLLWCRRTRGTDPRVRQALRYFASVTEAAYRAAAPGIELLAPESRGCVRTAYRLYAAILDRIEAADYPVLHHRVTVSRPRRLVIAAPALLRSYTGSDPAGTGRVASMRTSP